MPPRLARARLVGTIGRQHPDLCHFAVTRKPIQHALALSSCFSCTRKATNARFVWSLLVHNSHMIKWRKHSPAQYNCRLREASRRVVLVLVICGSGCATEGTRRHSENKDEETGAQFQTPQIGRPQNSEGKLKDVRVKVQQQLNNSDSERLFLVLLEKRYILAYASGRRFPL